MENLHQYLSEELDQSVCLFLNDSQTQQFIRIFTIICDNFLVFYPLVEVLVTLENENVKIVIVTYKGEILETKNFDHDRKEDIRNQIKEYLHHKKYKLCQVHKIFFIW